MDVDRLEGNHASVNFNDSAVHAGALALVHTDLVALHVDSLAALHQCLLDHLVHLVVIQVLVIVVSILRAVLERGCEVCQFLVARLDGGGRIYLLKSKCLEQEASVHELVANGPHVFAEGRVFLRLLISVVETRSFKVELLRHSSEE